MENDVHKVMEYLSPNEQRVLPFLKESVDEVIAKSGLDEVSVLRALDFLQNKGIVKLDSEKKKIVDLGVNGILYKRNGLPERRLLNFLSENKGRLLALDEAQKLSKLSKDEFKAALGALKKKALIELKNGKIAINASSGEILKKFLEEKFIDALPLEFDKLEPEQKHSFEVLKNRRGIVLIEEKRNVSFELTDLGKKIINLDIKDDKMIEQLTPEIIKNQDWKGKKFRRYDISSKVPAIYGGKRHFVNQAIDYTRSCL